MDIYRHKQVGTWLLWGLSALAVVVSAVFYAQTRQPLVAAAIAGLLVLTTALTSSLEVAVTRREVTFAFGLGVFRRRLPVEQIAAARPVRNTWWYGWGIHLTPHGWLYNVSGLDAVEIQMTTGKKLRIGTDEPQRLLAAIRQAAPGLRTEA
jgi:hypothetical protein